MIIACRPRWRKDGIRCSLRDQRSAVVLYLYGSEFEPVPDNLSNHVTSLQRQPSSAFVLLYTPRLQLVSHPTLVAIPSTISTSWPSSPFVPSQPLRPKTRGSRKPRRHVTNALRLGKPVVPRSTRRSRSPTSWASVWNMSLLERTFTI